MLTPIMAPTAMAIAELISRFRKSTRCSKNDIFPPASCSGGTAGASDCGVVIRRFLLGRGRRVRHCRGLVRVRVGRQLAYYWSARVCGRQGARHSSLWFHRSRRNRGRLDWAGLRLGRGQGGLRLTNAGLALELAYFFFQGVAKISSHLAEFGSRLAEHPGEFRQLLRAKDNQGHDKQNDQMWHAQHGRWSVTFLRCLQGLQAAGSQIPRRAPLLDSG